MDREPDPGELAAVDVDELESIDIRLDGWPAPSQRRPARDPRPASRPCPCHGVRVADPTPLELVDGR